MSFPSVAGRGGRGAVADLEEDPTPPAEHTHTSAHLEWDAGGNRGHTKDLGMFFSLICFWNNPALDWEADLTESSRFSSNGIPLLLCRLSVMNCCGHLLAAKSRTRFTHSSAQLEECGDCPRAEFQKVNSNVNAVPLQVPCAA